MRELSMNLKLMNLKEGGAGGGGGGGGEKWMVGCTNIFFLNSKST